MRSGKTIVHDRRIPSRMQKTLRALRSGAAGKRNSFVIDTIENTCKYIQIQLLIVGSVLQSTMRVTERIPPCSTLPMHCTPTRIAEPCWYSV
jgi:hypothetical protein